MTFPVEADALRTKGVPLATVLGLYRYGRPNLRHRLRDHGANLPCEPKNLQPIHGARHPTR